MPIAPELRPFYRTPEWFARAQGQCEWCGKPSRKVVRVALDGSGRWYCDESSRWRSGLDRCRIEELRAMHEKASRPGSRLHLPMEVIMHAELRPPRNTRSCFVVLSVAHLDHNPGNNAPENIAALCQRCHLVFDGAEHRRNARLRRDRETGQLRLELVEC